MLPDISITRPTWQPKNIAVAHQYNNDLHRVLRVIKCVPCLRGAAGFMFTVELKESSGRSECCWPLSAGGRVWGRCAGWAHSNPSSSVAETALSRLPQHDKHRVLARTAIYCAASNWLASQGIDTYRKYWFISQRETWRRRADSIEASVKVQSVRVACCRKMRRKCRNVEKNRNSISRWITWN